MEPVTIGSGNTKIQEQINSLNEFIKNFENNDKGKIYTILENPDNIELKNFEVENEDLYNINGIICFKIVNTLQCPDNNNLKNYFDQFIKDLDRQLFYIPEWEDKYYKFHSTDKNIFYKKIGNIMTNINANINSMLSLNEPTYRKYYKNNYSKRIYSAFS